MHISNKPLINRSLLTGVALGALALASAYSVPARACSAPPCSPPVRLFGKDANVPGNLVYFKLLDPSTISDEAWDAHLKLETDDHEPIAASVRRIGNDRVFAPNEPIPAGTGVILTYRLSCHGSERDDVLQTYEFTTREAADDPLRETPSLELLREGVSTRGDEREAFSELRYHSADATGDLDHLITSYAGVSDVRGRLPFDGTNLRIATRCADKDADSVDTCDEINFVPEGAHTVSVHSTIVGFDAPPTITAEVETRCESPADDQGESEPSGSDERVKTTSGGCSLAASSRANVTSLLSTLAVLMVSLRRSRRSRGEPVARRPGT